MKVKELKLLLANVDENAEIVMETSDSGRYRSINPIWVQKGNRGHREFYEGADHGLTGDTVLWVFE